MARRYSGKLISTSMRSMPGFSYELQRRRMKMVRLRVRKEDGLLVVSAPPYVSIAEIESFIESRVEWIAEQRTEISLNPYEQLRMCHTGETLSVWGELYTLEVGDGPQMSLNLGASGIARMVAPVSVPTNQRRIWLREWYRDVLKTEVEHVLPIWVERTGLVPSEWRARWMKTRWGSCAIRARRIWLNVQLAKYPHKFLDYVIVHELCHLEVPNHGPRFQALMDEYMPEWRSLRRELSDWRIEYTE